VDELLNRAGQLAGNLWDAVGPTVAAVAGVAFLFYLLTVWLGGD
jgi:hypothetical protein